MKSYYTQNYPVSIWVRVTLLGDSWIDGHKGLNKGHALYLAKRNWDGAKVEFLSYNYNDCSIEFRAHSAKIKI